MGNANILIALLLIIAGLAYLAGYLYGFSDGKEYAEDEYRDNFLNDEKEVKP
jgi:hypothetical protein